MANQIIFNIKPLFTTNFILFLPRHVITQLSHHAAMPLPKRCVEPVHVSRGTVPERLQLPSELEAATNGTLANTVRQLSSLSKHAEDMFGELSRSASGLAERTNVLQARIDRLAIKVTQLDSAVEEVSLQDIQMRKAFRSSRTFQQQLFSRNTIPSAMLATYAKCDPPPPLERLNEFRDDGRDARKFYTDPDYFFELWRREMLQDTERIQHDRGKKVRQPRTNSTGDGRAGRRVRVPHSTRDRQMKEAVTRGEHIMAPSQLQHYNIRQQAPQEPVYQTTVTDGGYRATGRPPQTQAARPNSIEIDNQSRRLTGNGHVVVSEDSDYGTVQEGIYGGSLAGTPRRPRPSVPPPAPPPEHDTPTRSALPPPPPPPEAASPPPLVNGASPPLRTALDAHLDHMHAVIAVSQFSILTEYGINLKPEVLRGRVAAAARERRVPAALDAHLDHMHAVIGMMSSEATEPAAPPPPPPPPAPPAPPADDRPRPPSPGALLRGASQLKPPRAPEPQVDPRSDLLKAIRDGVKLRKAEKKGDDTVGRYDTLRGVPAFLDVASILARRVAVELSDSSSGDSDTDDSDQWTESRAPPKKESPPVSSFKVSRTGSKDESVVESENAKEVPVKKDIPVKEVKVEQSVVKEVQKKEVVKEVKKEVVAKELKVLSPVLKEVKVKPEKLSLPAEVKEPEKESVNGKTSDKHEVETPPPPIQNSITSEKAKNEESNGVGDKIKKFEKAAEDAGSSATLGRQSRAGSTADFELKKSEPQKIIKPEFKPLQSNAEATIRSPSLGSKLGDQFPSSGTAFRNVADTPRHNDDNTHNNVKPCKFKNKDKYSASVSKGSSYFTRGSEEIWLVKKKDIEEIEQRVLDSFHRAGGNVCVRESARASSDGGQASLSHTLGRPRRQMYARSESLDPQHAQRSQTLKRQTSVACTCGHDKKPRSKPCDARPRSRSHGDDNSQTHVLDKYETLV
ncbi:unnamed protein product [Plutella xylostella]|uniref:Wiskott-Aldrich syndrome protein family member n=1 Tax=Plutella xylostella TaxID=51655 RepID=A0A8S4FTY1_PLUXY|nr:unnamed protein product [Plutella xylostella]